MVKVKFQGLLEWLPSRRRAKPGLLALTMFMSQIVLTFEAALVMLTLELVEIWTELFLFVELRFKLQGFGPVYISNRGRYK